MAKPLPQAAPAQPRVHERTYTINMPIRNLDDRTNRILNAYAKLTGKYKHEVVGEALRCFAEMLEKSIPKGIAIDRSTS